MSPPIRIRYAIPELFGSRQQELLLYGGLTTFIGPNGSGKTQVLRRVGDKLRLHVGERRVRYLSAGRMAPLAIFRDNLFGVGEADGGPKIGDRLRPATLLGDLHVLSRRPDLLARVSDRLGALFGRKIDLEWDAEGFRVVFSRGVQVGDAYSYVREASGLLQLVAILAALYDDENGALLLDEPEISLHPQLQAFLLREIRQVAGDPALPGKKLVVISTHSTHMLSVRQIFDVPRLVFFRDADTDPLQVPADADELQNRKIQALMPHFGENYRHAFFSSRPLLVEGPSDAAICHALDDHCGIGLEAAGSQVVPVVGKGTMGTVVRFLRLIGKSPVILADLDAFADGSDIAVRFASDPAAWPAAGGLGCFDIPEAARTAYDAFANAVHRAWDDMADAASLHPYWTRRKLSTPEDQAKRRAALATVMNTSPEQILAWSNGERWLALRHRLEGVFALLEQLGCFILRRGSIEDYYLVEDNPYLDKIAASLFEAERLCYIPQGIVEAGYDDLLRALRFAAALPGIGLPLADHLVGDRHPVR